LGLRAFFIFRQKKLSSKGSTHQLNREEVLRMAANSKQGTYLATTLTGFTALTGGLASQGAIAIVVALVGLVLLIVSAAGFHKTKSLG